jgi:hypothetical protein
MFKKILPAVTGAIGFAVAGPVGASIGAGIGSAVRGDNPANIATSALMGYGLGALGGSAGLVGGQGLAALGSSVGTVTGLGGQAASAGVGGQSAFARPALGQAAKDAVAREAASPGLLAQAGQFIKNNPLTAGALGLGAVGALSAMEDEEEGVAIPDAVTPGSIAPLDATKPGVSFFDPATGSYGAAAPTYRSLKDGGFPRKTGQISGPGTEKSDDIPAMLSDGEFVMTAKAVRRLGALNGAKKGDKLEQRRRGAKQMYDMMDKFESKVA